MERYVRLSIASVERDIGVSKDVLRVWERRYGFPTPERDANGERLYPVEQVERLRLVKRLMDMGHRPGRLLSMPVEELQALSRTVRPPRPPVPLAVQEHEDLDDLVSLVKQHRADDYVQALQHRLGRLGLSQFVHKVVAPLTGLVGLNWETGQLKVFEEHLYTELTERVLRQAIAAVQVGHEPRILLTSVPNEQHALGLLMVEAVLSLEGAHCISLGTQVPVLEIAEAASAHRADIVGLSFSEAFPKRQISAVLRQLSGILPTTTRLWAGGSGASRVTAPEGVRIVATLEAAAAAVAKWRGGN